jgi:hypothetical protein
MKNNKMTFLEKPSFQEHFALSITDFETLC